MSRVKTSPSLTKRWKDSFQTKNENTQQYRIALPLIPLNKEAVGNVFPVTRWLILSSAYKSWQSLMVSHRAVNKLIYHDGLSGLICRALSQPQSYKETFSFRHWQLVWGRWYLLLKIPVFHCIFYLAQNANNFSFVTFPHYFSGNSLGSFIQQFALEAAEVAMCFSLLRYSYILVVCTVVTSYSN